MYLLPLLMMSEGVNELSCGMTHDALWVNQLGADSSEEIYGQLKAWVGLQGWGCMEVRMNGWGCMEPGLDKGKVWGGVAGD